MKYRVRPWQARQLPSPPQAARMDPSHAKLTPSDSQRRADAPKHVDPPQRPSPSGRHGRTSPSQSHGVSLCVRRVKVLVFSGCKSRLATGSLRPGAIGAAVEVTKPSKPSRQMCRLGDAASRQAVMRSERQAGLETSNVGADLAQRWGRPPSLGMMGEAGIGRTTSDQNPAGHRGNDDGMSVHGEERNTGNPRR